MHGRRCDTATDRKAGVTMSAAIEFDGGTSTLFDIPVGGFWFRIKIWNLEHENSPP